LHGCANRLNIANQNSDGPLHLDVAVYLRRRDRVGAAHDDGEHGECLASVVKGQHTRLVIASREALTELDDGHPSNLGEFLGIDTPRRVRLSVYLKDNAACSNG